MLKYVTAPVTVIMKKRGISWVVKSCEIPYKTTAIPALARSGLYIDGSIFIFSSDRTLSSNSPKVEETIRCVYGKPNRPNLAVKIGVRIQVTQVMRSIKLKVIFTLPRALNSAINGAENETMSDEIAKI